METPLRTLYLDNLPSLLYGKKCGIEVFTYIYGMGSLDLWLPN